MTRLGLDTQESKTLVSVIVADVYAFIYPDVNTKDTTFNLFLPSRVYFFGSSNIVKQDCITFRIY